MPGRHERAGVQHRSPREGLTTRQEKTTVLTGGHNPHLLSLWGVIQLYAFYRNERQQMAKITLQVENGPSVLVVTSLAPGKEYCLPFLGTVLSRLQGVSDYLLLLDGVDISEDAEIIVGESPRRRGKKRLGAGASPVASPAYFLQQLHAAGKVVRLPDWEELPGKAAANTLARCARMREAARQYFLAGAANGASKWTHLYFHDCDIIPPPDIVPRLLRYGREMASGLYCIRGVSEAAIPLMAAEGTGGPLAEMAEKLALGDQEAPTFEAVGFGMGAMLIGREALARTAFRPRAYFEQEWFNGEDYQFCLDAVEQVQELPLVEITLGCWHVDRDGMAARLQVGTEVRPGVLYADAGWGGRTRLGVFHKGVPRFDIPEAEWENLGPSFLVKPCREVSLERRHWRCLIVD